MTPAAVLVALLAGAAVVLLVRPVPRASADRPTWTPGRSVIAAGAAGAAGFAVLLLHGHQLGLGLIAVAVALAAQRLLTRQRAGRAAEKAAGRVMEFCEAVAAELAAGRPPHLVLRSSVDDFPEFGTVAGAAELGSDVPGELRRLATAPGCADLRLVAAAWQVAHRSGAGMADSLERVGCTLRERRRTARVVAAELAAAHATTRIMAALPVVFVLAGSGLGADPVGFLTGGTAGVVCLAAGLALTYAGLAWLQRISAAVAGP
jgi:tight adherence protein B